jgi:hypothetical protein
VWDLQASGADKGDMMPLPSLASNQKWRFSLAKMPCAAATLALVPPLNFAKRRHRNFACVFLFELVRFRPCRNGREG